MTHSTAGPTAGLKGGEPEAMASTGILTFFDLARQDETSCIQERREHQLTPDNDRGRIFTNAARRQLSMTRLTAVPQLGNSAAFITPPTFTSVPLPC